MKKELNKILMFIGFIVTVVGAIICGVADEENVGLVFTTAQLAALFAVTFIFAKNEVVKNFGYGLAGLTGAYGAAVLGAEIDDLLVSAIGMIIMLVAAAIYFFVICLKFFGFVKAGEVNTCHAAKSKDLLATLSAYKEMQQEKVLSDEEFSELKQKVFEAVENKAVSVDDLKKWKKLLDQQVITEEEFSQIKADLFSK